MSFLNHYSVTFISYILQIINYSQSDILDRPPSARQDNKGAKVPDPIAPWNTRCQEQRVITLLNRQNIFKVFDLIRYTESQLSRFDGMMLNDLNTIVGCLDHLGLCLDMDIRWIDALQEYYIKR
jgi:DNA-directed RNA polymerase alpha subunit